MRGSVPGLPTPYPLASYLPDVYLEGLADDTDAETRGGTAPFPPGAYALAIGGDGPLRDAERGLAGEWLLSLSAGRTAGDTEAAGGEAPVTGLLLALARDGKGVATGTARIEADTLSVTSSNCGAAAGTYRWSFSGRALELEAIEDACAARRALLTAGAWETRTFSVRFLSAFDDVLAPVFSSLDNIDAYFDPHLAPDDFVEWLAGWVDLALDRGWPLRRRRDRIARAVALAVNWGTVDGLKEVVSVFAGVDSANVEVVENGGVTSSATRGGELPGTPEPQLKVRVKVADPAAIDTERLNRVVAAVKPAHLVHEVEVVAA